MRNKLGTNLFQERKDLGLVLAAARDFASEPVSYPILRACKRLEALLAESRQLAIVAVVMQREDALRVMRLASAQFDVSLRLLLGRNRLAHIVWPRQVAWAVMHDRGIPALRIGQVFGRNHGTIFHAVRTVENRCQTEPARRLELDELRRLAAKFNHREHRDTEKKTNP